MDKKIKFLIIDDENIVLQSCKKILNDKNFEVVPVFSGESGLEKIEKEHFDIVITDLMMPGMSGMEVLKKIVKEKPEITVIIFTGFATVESVREALKLGAFDYIPKPFTPQELRDVVNNAIKAREDHKETKMLDLMAIVSHDLKSPLSVVHTNAETLYQGYFGDLDAKQKKTVESIIRNCVYLEDIIRTYIDLSQMGMDSIGSFKRKVDLVEDVIRPVVEVPEHQMNIRKMTIKTDYLIHPEVMADPNLLKIVVTNFLNNAIKYGNNNSEIRIKLDEDADSYVFSIFNEGVGISKEDIETKLFKKYNRLKQKGTEGIKGNGLGLYICKTIIDKHHGKIWAESEQDSWVKFCFSIPKVDVEG